MGYCDNCPKCGFFYDQSRNDLCPKCVVTAAEEDETSKRLKELFAAEADAKRFRAALEKIADPRKRDHQEPDAYTQLGCVMNIAAEALSTPNASQEPPPDEL